MNTYVAVGPDANGNFAIFTVINTTDINGNAVTMQGPQVCSVNPNDLQNQINDLTAQLTAIQAAQGGATPAQQYTTAMAAKTTLKTAQ